MVKIDVSYEGELHCKATHGPSADTLCTDAPVDNNGRGAAFSPTDLLATGLGSCILTVMGIVAERKGLDLKSASADVSKEMSSSPPRRISRLAVRLRIPLPENHPERPILEKTALSCPVYQSLHPDIEKNIAFVWEPAPSA